MKWNEAVLSALGGIEEDAVPDEIVGDPEEMPPGSRFARLRRVLAGSAAAVLLTAGIGAGLNRLRPAEPAPSPETAAVEVRMEEMRHYLSPGRSDDFFPVIRILDLPAVPSDAPALPAIQTGDPADVSFADFPVFRDRGGQLVRVCGAYTEDDSRLVHNLRHDLVCANFTRAFGCVLWSADWDVGIAEYLGVVKLLTREETERRLCAGECLTAVPPEDTPVLTEETLPALTGRRTLVYLLVPGEEYVAMYECFFLRLENGWGTYFVPAADLAGAGAIVNAEP